MGFLKEIPSATELVYIPNVKITKIFVCILATEHNGTLEHAYVHSAQVRECVTECTSSQYKSTIHAQTCRLRMSQMLLRAWIQERKAKRGLHTRVVFRGQSERKHSFVGRWSPDTSSHSSGKCTLNTLKTRLPKPMSSLSAASQSTRSWWVPTTC